MLMLPIAVVAMVLAVTIVTPTMVPIAAVIPTTVIIVVIVIVVAFAVAGSSNRPGAETNNRAAQPGSAEAALVHPITVLSMRRL